MDSMETQGEPLEYLTAQTPNDLPSHKPTFSSLEQPQATNKPLTLPYNKPPRIDRVLYFRGLPDSEFDTSHWTRAMLFAMLDTQPEFYQERDRRVVQRKLEGGIELGEYDGLVLVWDMSWGLAEWVKGGGRKGPAGEVYLEDVEGSRAV
ncbi:hypothetical protein BP6252_07428 [Coleophoma cylindrospora]|uniref:Uncharacterized protein n=1 Tax=Coleophoma cylindrospora TaxID=1849047 RepID=A0A3D8RI49_9HELO|nr:hypothetical protein BP6252_07428 [Coleophoma cylindrospora]